MDRAIGTLLLDAHIFGIHVQYWVIAFTAFFALWGAYEFKKRE